MPPCAPRPRAQQLQRTPAICGPTGVGWSSWYRTLLDTIFAQPRALWRVPTAQIFFRFVHLREAPEVTLECLVDGWLLVTAKSGYPAKSSVWIDNHGARNGSRCPLPTSSKVWWSGTPGIRTKINQFTHKAKYIAPLAVSAITMPTINKSFTQTSNVLPTQTLADLSRASRVFVQRYRCTMKERHQ